MCQVTVTTTSPHMIVVCPGAVVTTVTVMMALTHMGLAAALGQHGVVLPPLLILRDTIRDVGLTTVPQQQVPYASPGLYQLSLWSSSGEVFFFRVGLSTNLILVSYNVFFLLSDSNIAAMFINRGSTIGVCTTSAHQSEHMAGIYVSLCWSVAHTRKYSGNLVLFSQLLYCHSVHMVVHTTLGAWQTVTHSLHFPYLTGISFLSQVFFPPSDTVNSEAVFDIKPGDSSVFIWFQVEGFTHTWSAGYFVDLSYIYHVFIVKVSLLTHFPLEPGCEDYSF